MANATESTEIVYRDALHPTTLFYRMTVTKRINREDAVESYEQWSVDQARLRGGDDGAVLVGIVGHQLHAIHESEVV